MDMIDDMEFIEEGSSLFNREKRKKFSTEERPAPESIIDALDRVQDAACSSKLCDEFWKAYTPELDYLTLRTGLSKEEAVIIGAMCEIGDAVSWKRLANFFSISRLRMMNYTPAMESLKQKRWIRSYGLRDMDGLRQGFKIVSGVIKALREDHPYVPEKISGLTEQQFVERLGIFMCNEGRDDNLDSEEKSRLLMLFVEENPELPLCQRIRSLTDDSSKVILLMVIGDYAHYAETPREGVHFRKIMEWYDNSYQGSDILDTLQNGDNELLKEGLIEFKCCDGLVDPEVICLSSDARNQLLGEFNPKFNNDKRQSPDIIKFDSIKAKKLYFNETDRIRIDRLRSILCGDTLDKIRGRLKESGMREGISCLFYGVPGTGKTESVLQLARESGRDVLQVDIAAMRDKYVGESEKNIRSVFMRYRHLCTISDITPILLFNEADAIFGKRFESVKSSVEKMDNAMQNIILEEMEKLNGIMIATTNLTGNFDTAFDRRFLFKVEFSRPVPEVRRLIWQSIMPDMNAGDALALASEFDLSGGQIENVARKCKIEYILTGKTPTLSDMRSFSREEKLNRSLKSRIGF